MSARAPAGYRALTREFVLESKEDVAQCAGFIRSLVITTTKTEKGERINAWRVAIEPDEKKRTPLQNKRQWAAFRYIAANAWVNGKRFSAEAWHAHYCGEFIGFEEGLGMLPVPLGTGTLNTKEHINFIERVQADAASKHGVDWTHWEENEP